MTRADRTVLALILGFSLVYALLAWNGVTPYVLLTGDAANNASIAAAMDHPELFRGDALLGDAANFRFYRILQLPLIRLLNPLVGGYGTANLALLAPHLILHLCGFYLLGLLLTRSRLWAALGAFLLLAPIHVNMGTFWGVHRDSLARCTFQALLPWLLCAAWTWRHKPMRWPLVMIGAGLLMGVHAVSAPTWGFAFWLGFALFLPLVWPLWRKLGWMLVQGLVFLAAAAPIALNYLAGHAHGAETGTLPMLARLFKGFAPAQELLWERKYQAVRQAWLDRFQTQTGLLKLGDAITGFFTPAMLALVAAGLAAVWLLRRGQGERADERREGTRLILGWIAGVLCVTVGLTGLEQLWARLTDSVVVEMNLVRGLRFLIPLLLLAIIWAAAALHARLKDSAAPLARDWAQRHRRALAAAMVTVMVLVLCGAWYEELRKRTGDQRDGYVLAMTPAQRDLLGALDYLRNETPAGSLVLPVGEERDLLLTVRYQGLRPVAYAWKDGGVLGYADNDKMLAWHQLYLRAEAIRALDDAGERAAAWAAMARDLGAAYVFWVYEDDEARAPLPGAEPVFQGDAVAVYRLAP